MSIENEILNYVGARPPISIHELIKYLIESHKDENGKPERGYNSRTIYGRLKSMEKAGQIAFISKEDLRSYKITPHDGRLQYITLKNASERKKHLDDIFSRITHKRKIDPHIVFEEIERYEGKYILSPNQLDVLVSWLGGSDITVTEKALKILYDYVLDIKIKPDNSEALLEKIRTLTAPAENSSSPQYRIRRNALRILGYYNDDEVIQQLKTDLLNPNPPESLGSDYQTPAVARVIEAHRNDLFYLQDALKKKKRDDLAKILSEIRTFAADHENDSIYIHPDQAYTRGGSR
jgi:hypothetical protein